MKKFLLIATVVFFSAYLFGCGRRQAAEEAQEPLSMETLTSTNTAVLPAPEAKVIEPKPQVALVDPLVQAKLEPLPPVGSYKPTPVEIQTALKNAGFYSGNIDGKIGPKSKKAIEEFQKANNLKSDGKVGPKTWEILSRHLNLQPAPAAPAKR